MSQGWNQERYLEEIERREAQSARAKKRLIRQSVILGVVITTCLIMVLTIGTAPKVTRSEALIPKTTEPVDTPVETAPDCSRHTWTNDLDPRCHPTTTEVVMRHKTNTTIHISHPTTSIARHTTTTISTAMQISSWCATFSQVVVSGTDGQINQIAEQLKQPIFWDEGQWLYYDIQAWLDIPRDSSGQRQPFLDSEFPKVCG